MFDLLPQFSNNSLVQSALYAALLVGVYKLTVFTLSTASLVADLFLRPATDWSQYGAGKGCWAVVTGASDGIGKEFALQLAKRGFSVVLVLRTQAKLEALAQEIAQSYKVATRVISFDAAADRAELYEEVARVCRELPVTVLVNNVGQLHLIPVPFAETEDAELRSIITINTTATLKITQAVLPLLTLLVEAHKAKRALILTMGLFGGLLPTPYLATYSGLKAFLQAWSAALAGELQPQGVDVELVVLYLVTLAMSKIRRASLTIPTPKKFVALVLSLVGRRGGAQERYATLTPYWTHALMHYAIENTVGVYLKLANGLNGEMHRGIRARALKKRAKKQ